jgi:hypothetical protein
MSGDKNGGGKGRKRRGKKGKEKEKKKKFQDSNWLIPWRLMTYCVLFD